MIDPLVDNDPAFKVAVPSENVALVMVADVLSEPDFRVAVPSVKVPPNTCPRAETLDADEITPLVIDPLVDNNPERNVAVPSVNDALVMVAEVVREPDLSVAVPSVKVEPNICPNAEMLEAEEITPLVMDPLVVKDPAFKVTVPSVNVEPNT